MVGNRSPQITGESFVSNLLAIFQRLAAREFSVFSEPRAFAGMFYAVRFSSWVNLL